MTHAQPSLRLYLANRREVLLTPLYILTVMVLLSVAITLIIAILAGYPIPDEVRANMRYNGGALYAVPGFLISVGVLAMTRNLDMALAFGSTRRSFWFGTGLGFVVTSSAVGLYAIGFLALERLTNHWFIGAQAFDVAFLGSGNPLRTFLTMFLLSILTLFLGAFFGMVYRSFGTFWTSAVVIAVSLLALGVVALIAWQWASIEPLWQALGGWLLLALTAVVALAAAGGSYLMSRVATI